MCFKNLPIEFDADGNPGLKKGGESQWAVAREPDRPRARPGAQDGDGTVTRVVSVHGLHTLLVRAPARPSARPGARRTLN